MRIYSRLLLMVSLLFSQNGLDISEMIQNRKVPKDVSNIINMTLINSKGKKRTNKMISKSKDRNKKQIMWFLEPKGDRGVAFLKIEKQFDTQIFNYPSYTRLVILLIMALN